MATANYANHRKREGLGTPFACLAYFAVAISSACGRDIGAFEAGGSGLGAGLGDESVEILHRGSPNHLEDHHLTF